MGLFEKAFWFLAGCYVLDNTMRPKPAKPKRKATYWDAAIGFVVFMLFYMLCC